MLTQESLAHRIGHMLVYNPDATRIVLDLKSFTQLKKEVMSYRRLDGDYMGEKWTFFGLPIHTEMPREFCRNCGAPIEPNECSYCKTSSTIITVE